jgi:hypothetical protein
MTIQWIKSSYSKDWNQALCVEVASTDGGHHLIRDSKHPDGAVLVLTDAGWSEFMQWTRSM